MNEQTSYYSQERSDVLEAVRGRLERRQAERGALHILDVGCASGRFASSLKQSIAGSIVWGVEPHGSSADRARGRIDHVVHAPFSEALVPQLDQTFDFIFFNDSFEHIFDSEQTLRAARQLLTGGGELIFSLPNLRYIKNLYHLLVQRDFSYEPHGIRDRTHCRFFTRKSFEKLLHRAGIEIVAQCELNPRTTELSWKGRTWRYAVRPLLRALLFRHKDITECQLLIVARPRLIE